MTEKVTKEDIRKQLTRLGHTTNLYSSKHAAGKYPEPASWEERAKELEIKRIATDIALKERTLNLLFIFLAIETVIIFVFTFFQAIKGPHSFYLEEWSFRLIIAGTLTQITLMLNVAVKHLFPAAKQK